MSTVSYENAWSAISDISKSCREFNELQFKYRQLAITLVLAAYAAIGYFMALPDPAIKAAEEAKTYQTQKPASGTPQGAPAGTGNPTLQPSAPHVRKVSLVILGIGFLAALATLLIWIIDTRIYHRLLRANFDEAEKFENSTFSFADTPPKIHTEMRNQVTGSYPVILVSIFYAVASVALIAPWHLYNVLSSATPVEWWTNEAHSIYGLYTALLAVLVTAIYVLWPKKTKLPKILPKKAKAAPNAPDAETLASLLDSAKQASTNAYAKYSSFGVGAAVLAFKGNEKGIFSGCNVENIAYGSTICAERNALAAAIVAGYRNVSHILVYTDTPTHTSPCGACLQALNELASNAQVHLVSSGTQTPKTQSVRELLPHPFDPGNLRK